MSKLKLGGTFTVEQVRDGKIINKLKAKNGVVNEGLDEILDVMFHNVAQTNPWYIGLIDNTGFTALASNDTMASHAGWAEAVPYSDATRQDWGEGSASAQSITNATPAEFNINTSATLYGLFLTSSSVKSGTTGTLWSTAAFSSPVNAVNGDTFKVTYTLNSADA